MAKRDTVQVTDHYFEFKDTIVYPLQFRLSVIDPVGKEYISEFFFVDTGFQVISLDSLTKVNTPFDFGCGISIKSSATNNEYINRYLPLFDSVNKKISAYFLKGDQCDTVKNIEAKNACKMALLTERNNSREERNDILLKYATNYPGSPILPWLLVEYVNRFGYKEKYQRIFNLISPYLFPNVNQFLKILLDTQNRKRTGNHFPLNNFLDTALEKNTRNDKYTLVEFWFSGCGPCIGQFNLLKSVYEKYKGKGFEIIAISVDSKKAIPEYKKVLKLNHYEWKQVLDTGGIKTAPLNISDFPSSFLLDGNWKIISVNLTPAQLDILLQNFFIAGKNSN